MNKIYQYLYIGSYYDLNNKDKLLELGITNIINLTQTVNPYPELFNYYKIDINDSDENISKYFNKTNKFICNSFIKGNKVLVCCFEGISRSSTIILAFLIRKRRLSLENALIFIKTKRRIISPNSYFLEQLVKYDKFDYDFVK